MRQSRVAAMIRVSALVSLAGQPPIPIRISVVHPA
jgi:hypothetical protein